MNGAQALVETLSACGVRTCFANPGTSEMHMVYALDSVEDFDSVLCLDEGVVTGAADGYARMAGVPAATLLHLGPGLGNGWANLHNARRSHTPLINVVGDHATYHKRFDAPLESDIDSLARAVSRWVRRSSRSSDVGPDTADAVAAALTPPGGVATLILPADASWEEGAAAGRPIPLPPLATVPDEVVAEVVALLKGDARVVVLLGGAALKDRGLCAASRVAEATGATVLTETHTAHLQRGVGRPVFDALGYFAEAAFQQLAGAQHLITVGCRAPVAFFAYPGRPSSLVPEGCSVVALGQPGQDEVGALEEVASRVAPDLRPLLAVAGDASSPPAAEPLTPAVVGAVVGSALPEGAIVVEESITARPALQDGTVHAPPHDWLAHVGGAIGQGLPLATGAAVACPDRKVVCLEADGSAMYTIQALWTQARRNLDVTTVIMSNRAYAILQIEMHRIVAQPPGPRAASSLSLSGPDLDFATIARGMGVEAVRATTAGELAHAITVGMDTAGPLLIDARLV
ncbi:MAG: acetolactate synthase large subunit [Acidimicrobiaceae bacterium]|nr:acetolactate synthase large subunit [Acidimicrobiaceae bacterium]